MKNSPFLVINSGKFRGKRLEMPSKSTTRSTKSIVKGSFFDSFRYEIFGKNFIEMFGGSALMAAEAISNGALSARAIEIDSKAFLVTQKNTLSLKDENLIALKGDGFELVPQICQNLSDIVLYIDPPFDIRDGFSDIYQKVENMISNLPKDRIFLIAIEHISTYEPPQNLAKFTKFKSKKFGKTTLSYFS